MLAPAIVLWLSFDWFLIDRLHPLGCWGQSLSLDQNLVWFTAEVVALHWAGAVVWPWLRPGGGRSEPPVTRSTDVQGSCLWLGFWQRRRKTSLLISRFVNVPGGHPSNNYNYDRDLRQRGYTRVQSFWTFYVLN